MNIAFPEVRYANADGVHIAYEALGEGPTDLVRLPALTSGLLGGCLDPVATAFHARLAALFRLIRIDRRGMGLSDPLVTGGAPPLEQQAEDVLAVMDAVGSRRAAFFGGGDGASLAVFFAAMHPERVSALILHNNLPAAMALTDHSDALEELREHWGDVDSPWFVDGLAPSRLGEPGFVRLLAQIQQVTASKAAALANYAMRFESDLTAVLPLVQAPTLVLTPAAIPAQWGEAAELFAQRIPGARLVKYPGADIYFGAHTKEIGDAIEEFLTGARPTPASDRILATVLFTDIVGSTQRASQLGDGAWKELLVRFRATVRENLDRHRGREINTRGDDFLATFDGPARAINCGAGIAAAAGALGVEVRTGVHTGEIELMGDDIGGIAVHIGARVAALAGPGEVLVSRTVTDLVAGSGIEFEDRGEHDLKGVPGTWRLFSAMV